MNSYACASRVGSTLADGDYELVPAQDAREEQQGQLNAVEIHQDPGQASEEPAANLVPEGKPRSITYVFNSCNFIMLCLCIYVFRS